MVEVVRITRRPGAPVPKRDAPAPARPMSRIEIAVEIARIKQMGRTLRPPLNMRPNAFHEDKSELVRAIERLEDAVRQNRPLKVDA